MAVRRERLIDARGAICSTAIDTRRYTLLPNTAGCFTADDAVRVARLGREILLGLENPGADWVKLEVLADKKTLLPDPVATLEATERLVAEGFQVLCYTSDDPIIARRLKQAGAASVMPAGSPIGSGQGILNPNNIRICLEYLKEGDPDYPVIVDAGVGTASDVAIAMELGVDGVLLNTGIAHAADPLGMARAMRAGVSAGRLAWLSGRIPKTALRDGQQPGNRHYRSHQAALGGIFAPRHVGLTPRRSPSRPRSRDSRHPRAWRQNRPWPLAGCNSSAALTFGTHDVDKLRRASCCRLTVYPLPNHSAPWSVVIAMTKQKGSLLLVDDDRHVLESMADWLREQGYRLDAASDRAARWRRSIARRTTSCWPTFAWATATASTFWPIAGSTIPTRA